MVDSVDDAIAHINAHGSGHSEAIVTGSTASARAFQLGVDAACVYVNASTRFTDGGEFGKGAEIGNSTQKLHARGPIGLRGAVHVQVPGRGRGAHPGVRPRLAGRSCGSGILGGTFNPPHLGHLVCAQEAYRELELDRVMLIPARIPPHKPVEDEPGPEHRLELCRLAAEDDDRFEVSDLELRRDGPSYTVDTLETAELAGAQQRAVPDRRRRHRRRAARVASSPSGCWSWPRWPIAKRRGTSRDVGARRRWPALRGGDRARFFQMPRDRASPRP